MKQLLHLSTTALVLAPVLAHAASWQKQNPNTIYSNTGFGTLGYFAPTDANGNLQPPSASVRGGVMSATAPAHQYQTGVSTSGAPTFAQPSAGDVSGLAPSATTDTTNATNITSGMLPAAQLPAATTSVQGAVKFGTTTGTAADGGTLTTVQATANAALPSASAGPLATQAGSSPANAIANGLGYTPYSNSNPSNYVPVGTTSGTARDAAAAIAAETAAQTTANGSVQAAGGNASATVSTSTGSLFPRTPAARGADSVNLMDYGAYGDGLAHRLNGLFTTLAAAQVKYPAAYSLTETADQAAFDSAFAYIVANPIAATGPIGPQYKDLFVPTGGYDVDFVTVPPRVHMRGAGRQQTYIQGIISGGAVTSGLAVSSASWSAPGTVTIAPAVPDATLTVGQGYFITLSGFVPAAYNGVYTTNQLGSQSSFSLYKSENTTNPGPVTTVGTYGVSQAVVSLGLNPAYAGQVATQQKIFDNATVSDMTIAGGAFGYPASLALMDATGVSGTYSPNSGYIDTVSLLGGTEATLYIGTDRPAGYVHDLNERGAEATGDGVQYFADDWRFATGEFSDHPGGIGFHCVHGGYTDIYGFNNYSSINGIVKEAGCNGYIDWTAGSIDTNTGAAAILAATGSTDGQDGYVKFTSTRFETNSTAAAGPVIITAANALQLVNDNFTWNGSSVLPTYLIQNTGPVYTAGTNLGDPTQYSIAAVSNTSLAPDYQSTITAPANNGTNVAGTPLTLTGGAGSGTGVGGDVDLDVCPASTISGTTVNICTTEVQAEANGIVNVNGALTTTGSANVGTSLGVTGAATVGGTLSATGSTTLGSTLAVTGASSLSTLTTTGAATLASNAVTGNQTVGGNSVVTGAITSDTGITITSSTQYRGLTLGNGTNTVAVLQGRSTTNDDALLALENAGVIGMFLSAGTASYINNGADFTVGEAADYGYKVGVYGTLGVYGLASLNGGAKLPVLTVATLPTCSSTISGEESSVSDATSPTYLGTLTGGGTVHTPVFCNGTAWVSG